MKCHRPCSVLFLLVAIALGRESFADSQTDPAPPPGAPVKRSGAELEKLVAPIALYPDPLIATILPASVYPLEIVQAARFVADTNNLSRLDEQPWDENVRAVARIPAVIKQMNDDLGWTMELGEAFLDQDKELMDAMQVLREKARELGRLSTNPQQTVTVTNVVIEKTVEQKVVIVTNTIVQIQPSNPQVVYVPTYNPAVVYYPPPPAYVGPPPVVSFAAGVAVGAIVANNCDWHHGGCYRGDVNIDIDRNVNINRNSNVNRTGTTQAASTRAGQKWQPDQNRLSRSGTPTAAATSRQARGWGSGSAGRPTATTSPTQSSVSGNRRGAASTTPASVANRSGSAGSAFAGTSNGGRARESSSRGQSSRPSGGRGTRGGRR